VYAPPERQCGHHASREPTNISVMLSVCDRMFGTFQKAA